MARHIDAIKPTPSFIKSADKLLKKSPRLMRRIAATLKMLQDHSDLPGLHREPIFDTPIDNLYSLRVNKSIRLLEHESRLPTAFALYVDHHDEAYAWARQHHSSEADAVVDVDATWHRLLSGGAGEQQPSSPEAEPQPTRTFSARELIGYLGPADPGEDDLSCIPVDALCGLGLTLEEAEHIRQAPFGALFNDYLDDDLTDDILELYYKYTPDAVKASAAPMPIPLDPMDDDGVTITSDVQFLRMVEMGLDRYLTTITPEQEALAHTEQQRLLVVQGSGGSGKTTVAVHRLRYLADRIAAQPQLLASGERRVIYLCFNRTLAGVARQMVSTLYGGDVPDNVEVSTLDRWAKLYLEAHGVLPRRDGGVAAYRRVRGDLEGALAAKIMKSGADYERLTARFIAEEIRYVIIGRGISRLDDYLSIARGGRKTALRESERRLVWSLYEGIRADRRLENATGVEMYITLASDVLADDPTFTPYDAVIVDEAQDFTPIALRLARQLAGHQPVRIAFLGDAAQSIYPAGFSWSLPELSPRNREIRRLTRNHRNTVQIHDLAQAFLAGGDGPKEPDDYVTADRPASTGPMPVLLRCPNQQVELHEVVARIRRQIDSGAFPQNIGVLCGRRPQMEAMERTLRHAGIPAEMQTQSSKDRIHITQPSVKVLTMHSAKGLDFPHVYLVGLTEDGLPGKSLDVGDRYDDELAQQRRLLYTSMIRAGQTLVMTTVAGDNEHVLLADLRNGLYREELVADAEYTRIERGHVLD